MRPRLDSLRVRLIAGMLLVFCLGIAAERPLEEHIAVLVGFGPNPLQERYQDMLVLILFGLGAIALTWLVSGWSLRHLASASREAALVGPSTPGARISTKRLPQEVRPLVDAVNGALDRLAQAYEAERRFVGDAAHELRTPLAVLSLRLQRAELDGVLEWTAINRDMTEVNRLVAQLLDLARKEHARQAATAVGRSVVNLSRIAREAAAAVIPLADEAGRAIEVELPASLPIRGQVDDLRDMIRNLLDNALLHGRGTIRVTGQIETGHRDRHVLITISDEGDGVPLELREEMFDRFRKGRQDSPGHGLGLAIVREVVVGHGGAISFLPGPGCRMRLVLPSSEVQIEAKSTQAAIV